MRLFGITHHVHMWVMACVVESSTPFQMMQLQLKALRNLRQVLLNQIFPRTGVIVFQHTLFCVRLWLYCVIPAGNEQFEVFMEWKP